MNKAIPRHIGYIMDGNRRWAKSHGLPAYEGHLAGYAALKEVLTATLEAGVKYVSVYAFSSENWQRQEEEVSELMGLLIAATKKEIPYLIERGVQVKIVGRKDGLSKKVLESIDQVEVKTAANNRAILAICFNYSGELEIVDAVKGIVESGMVAEDITASTIADNLYAPDIPPCDLIVRTSGEKRLSNFMLFRSAYSELLFIEKYWPDMKVQDVSSIIDEYSSRQRRFGG